MEQERAWLLNEKYDGIESEAFFADVKRLEQGEPLAYVIGWIPFVHTRIYLDSKPLIPRPETEFWTIQSIQEMKLRSNTPIRVLDLCAGSGCCGIATLYEIPHSTVDFVELNPSHHETIRKNILENGIAMNRARILGGDLFEHISDTYDFILTNPPYIDPALRSRVQDSVIDHEPDEALFGGIDGMELIKSILVQAPRHLKPGGVLYIEHEPEQESAIKNMMPGIMSFPDQFGCVRFSIYRA